jgi:hypothetical protein
MQIEAIAAHLIASLRLALRADYNLSHAPKILSTAKDLYTVGNAGYGLLCLLVS